MRNWRGWVLLIASALLPGSVQSVLGGRSRAARISLIISLITWLGLLALLIVALVNGTALTGFANGPVRLVVLMVWLIVAGANWVFCMLDAVRRIRVGSLGRRTKPVFLSTALVVSLLVTGGVVWGATTLNSTREVLGNIFAAGPSQKPVDGRYNIALLGSDAGKGRQGVRPDSLSVVSIEVKSGKAVVIGLPRNLQNVPFPKDSPLHKIYPNGYNCGNECLINAVYQQGEEHAKDFKDTDRVSAGVQATEHALEGATGLDIQYYAMIDLKGFEQLINAMGGIRMNSSVRVPISGPIDPKTGQHVKPLGWIEPGKNIKLMGRDALWYARSREFASDYARMQRQRCVQEAMLKQMDPGTVAKRFTKIAKAAPNVVSTDIPQRDVSSFVDLAMKAKKQKMGKLNLTPPAVVPSHPDFAKMHKLVSQSVAKASKSSGSAAGAGSDFDSVQAMGPVGGSGQNLQAAGASADPTGDGKEICSVPK